MTKKKVLILSASIGTGHTQAARAIEEYVKTIPEECEVEHLDFLSNDVLSIDNIVKETYIKILDVFPMLYANYIPQLPHSNLLSPTTISQIHFPPSFNHLYNSSPHPS